MNANNQDDGLSEHHEIELLIPWFVTGKLDDVDRRRVERYLEAHPHSRRWIELAREEADGAIAIEQEVQAPGRHVLDGLMGKIEASPDRRAKRAAAGLWHRGLLWIDGLSPRSLAMAGAAAALLIAAQAASIGTLLIERQAASRYQTATGPAAAQTAGTHALVKFNPAAAVEAIATYLSENDFVIVDGPRANGLFRVRISREELGPEAATSLISKLQSKNDVIAFAVLSQQ